MSKKKKAMHEVEMNVEEQGPSCSATLQAAAELISERCGGGFGLVSGVKLTTDEIGKLTAKDIKKLEQLGMGFVTGIAAVETMSVIYPIYEKAAEVYAFLDDKGIVYEKVPHVLVESTPPLIKQIDRGDIDISIEDGRMVLKKGKEEGDSKNILLVSTDTSEKDRCDACIAVMDYIKTAIEQGKVRTVDINSKEGKAIIKAIFGDADFEYPSYIIQDTFGGYTKGDLKELLVEFGED